MSAPKRISVSMTLSGILVTLLIALTASTGRTAVAGGASTLTPAAVTGGALTPALAATQGKRLLRPPARPGCYAARDRHWVRVKCDSKAFIRKHLPHPEVLAGVGGTPGGSPSKPTGAAAFTLSVLLTVPLVTGSETDSMVGSNNYSLQNNVFFVGNNAVEDGVQFTDQISGSSNNVCVWQINLPSQNYLSNCNSVPGLAGPATQIEGWYEDGDLGVGAATNGGSKAIAVIVPDKYGLGSDDRWNNDSGAILGLGGGSQAVFAGTEEEFQILSTSCLDDAGFIFFSVFCSAQKVKPHAFVGYSAGPMTGGFKTLETNNLIPVIGSPPAHLPSLFYAGNFVTWTTYVASTTGKCFSGSPPFCR